MTATRKWIGSPHSMHIGWRRCGARASSEICVFQYNATQKMTILAIRSTLRRVTSTGGQNDGRVRPIGAVSFKVMQGR